MNTLFLYDTKTMRGQINTKIFAGDNLITKINVQIPDNIGGYPKKDCEFNLRAIIPEGNLSYIINPNEPYFYITNDITETAQTVKLMMIITHEGNVIGRTNTVDLIVNEPAEAPDPPLTPREEFDEVIAEQRAEIAEQAETISTQGETITQQTERITELNGEITEKDGQITELSTENTRLENLTDTQRETIQNMIDNPPQPKLYTPPVVTPSGNVQQINPPTGYDGLNNAVVDRVSAEGVNFHSEWYKEGKECLGKVGTYNPFPENSYGGIYITEIDEDGYPVKVIAQNLSKPKIPFVYPLNNDSLPKLALKSFEFKNCLQITTLANSCFENFSILKEVQLPEALVALPLFCFDKCSSLKEIDIPNTVKRIESYAFRYTAIEEIIIPHGVEYLGSQLFNSNALKTVSLPNTLTQTDGSTWYMCGGLQNVTIENGFNCNGLNVSASTRLTAETIVSCIEALADRTGEKAYTITFGSTNLNKLTAEQKAIATNKNWNLA